MASVLSRSVRRSTGIVTHLPPTSLSRPSCLTTSARPPRVSSAAEAADSLMERYSGKTIIRRQYFDNNQLQKLLVTLNRDAPRIEETFDLDGPPLQHKVPPGYHLIYFTPSDAEVALGADGTDTGFNPPAPFTRRMWAGGQMKWPSTGALVTGRNVEERTRLLSATPKKSRSAGEMVLVEVEKEYVTSEGSSLVDQRSWIFRPEITLDGGFVNEAPKPIDSDVRLPTSIQDNLRNSNNEQAYPVRTLRWSPVGLFRFSALTFNGHKIHYNQDWTQKIEGYPEVVVHGPLNLINILDYWRDVHGGGGVSCPREIQYRALSPIYAGEEYDIQTLEVSEDGQGRAVNILVVKKGVTCMKARVLGPPLE